MAKQATVGQILINSILPRHLRNYERVLDKKGVGEIMEGVAKEKDPDLYRNVVKALHDLGAHVAQSTGSSFSIRDMQTPPKTRQMMDALRAKVTETIERDDLTTDQKHNVVQNLVMKSAPRIDSTLKDELVATKNPFGTQIISGSRGGLGDVRSMMVGDLMVTDHKDRLVPIPILSSYAGGVDPADSWAGSYGTRKGGISTKLSKARTGFLGKQLVQVAHRAVVTTDDCGTSRGITVDANDPDNEGTVLQESVAGVPAGTVIDSKVMRTLQSKLGGDAEVTVRSPVTCKAKRGVCAKCTGVRERGTFPEIGDPVGVSAAHAVTERVTQAALSLKHGGGRATGKEQSDVPTGYHLINQLVQVPKSFKGGAAVASEDGTIKSVDKAPQGGYNIVIGEKAHHVPPGFEVQVKPGDRVEAGDVMSEGIPNPAELVRYRGVGDGRMQFIKIFRNALKDSGTSTNRRNIEMLARGLVNHVRVTDVDGVNDALPDDVVEYNTLERNYRPR
jgi:DNA-directed RNA polymerase subunit beta'